MMRNYDAFTLAEVLITLVIVGVIAAMTIPTLMNNTNKQEYVSKLKKVYSVLSNATNQIIFEQGTPNASLGGWASSAENILNTYKTKLAYSDKCIYSEGCSYSNSYEKLDGSGYDVYDSSRPKLILNDGTFLFFFSNSEQRSCIHNFLGSSNQCGEIYVDINGDKGPNKMGRDMFYFVIKENGLFLHGCDGDGYCNGPISSSGVGCSCKVIRENAMNY